MSVPGLRRGETPAREALEREAERQERRQERRDEEELEKARIPAATPEGEIAPVAPVLEVIPPAATREAEPGMRVEGPIAPPAPTAAAEAEAAARHATMRAMLLERDGRPAEALAAYQEALAAASVTSVLLWKVARLRLEQGSPEAALPVAEEAARLSPRDADVLMTYAQALYAVGDATGADLVFERVLEPLPRRRRWRPWRSSTTTSPTGRPPPAGSRLLKRDPGKLPVRHALGVPAAPARV
ncbi:tetratricopeptide repeat protein [bacterium]|nr:tetratricopeptide repeat protein [bacterium]